MIVIITHTPVAFVTTKLESELDKYFGQDYKEINKMKVKVVRNGRLSIDQQQGQIRLSLPLAFEIKKGEGIFTTEVSGSINLELGIDYIISKDLDVSVATKIISYQWIVKPKLEIGSLDISVERLVDMVIQYYSDDLLNTINAKLRPFLNLQRMIDLGIQDFEYVANKDLAPEFKIDFDVKDIFLTQPVIEKEVINLSGEIIPTIQISTKSANLDLQPMLTNFRWINEVAPHPIGFIDLKLMYTDICSLLARNLNGSDFGGKMIKIQDLTLNGKDNYLQFKTKLIEPIKGSATINFNPFYNESDGKIYVRDLDIDIEADSIFYKLGAPIFANLMESKINDFFPFDINQFISSKVKNIVKDTTKVGDTAISPQVSKVVVSELGFHFDSIESRVRYEGITLCVSNETKSAV
jgi:hypothetical protein